MAHQVPWNKIIVERFIEVAMLTEVEEAVLRTRVAGWSRTKQCEELCLSMSALDRVIKTLKKKYDYVQPMDTILPPRRTSAEEIWMDRN